MSAVRLVRVNERGLRIGEDHHHAVLTDHDVDLLLQLRAEGWGYRRLSAKFGVARSTVKRITTGARRGQAVAGFRVVPLPR